MKRISLILVLVFIQRTALSEGLPTPSTGSFVSKNATDKLNLRIHHQVAQIQKETKFGKLSKDQSKFLKSQVEVIRKAEIADLKVDNAKVLTDAQVAQLNGGSPV
jgi:hypothetical protein